MNERIRGFSSPSSSNKSTGRLGAITAMALIVFLAPLTSMADSETGGQPAVIFDDGTPGASSNLRANRASSPSYVHPFRTGIVNFGSDTSGNEPGATANYATIVGGDRSSAMGEYSVAGGYSSVAQGRAAFAIGDFVAARGTGAHAEGIQNEALANGSHVEGWNTLARSLYSHAEGSSCVTGLSPDDTQSLGAHAEGAGTIAGGGIGPHVEGYGSQAISQAAHAEGAFTTAAYPAAHAEGEDTQANAWRSHAEGAWTETRGIASHAEGMATLAQGHHSSAHGDSSIALRDTQWSIAGGNFQNDSGLSVLPPNARSHAQTSLLVMRAQTSGAANETTEFKYGTYADQTFALEDGKAYEITSTALLAGTLPSTESGPGRRAVRRVVTKAIVTCCDNGAPSVMVLEEDAKGDEGAADWRVQLIPSAQGGNRISWQLGTTSGSRINGVLRIDFSEVVFP